MIVHGVGELTYSGWDARADAVANILINDGVRPGEPVGLVFPHAAWLDYAVAFMGCSGRAASRCRCPTGCPRERSDFSAERAGMDPDSPRGPDRPLRARRTRESFSRGPRPDTFHLRDHGRRQGGHGHPREPRVRPAQRPAPPGVSALHPPRARVPHRDQRRSDDAGERHRRPSGRGDDTQVHLGQIREPCREISGRHGILWCPPWPSNFSRRGSTRSTACCCWDRPPLPLPAAVAVKLAELFPAAMITNYYTSTEAAPAQTIMVFDPERPGSVGRGGGRRAGPDHLRRRDPGRPRRDRRGVDAVARRAPRLPRRPRVGHVPERVGADGGPRLPRRRGLPVPGRPDRRRHQVGGLARSSTLKVEEARCTRIRWSRRPPPTRVPPSGARKGGGGGAGRPGGDPAPRPRGRS